MAMPGNRDGARRAADEGDVMRKYVHLGTGNYNPVTARLYTDLSLFTCDPQIGDDAVTLFNRLTGYAETSAFDKLLIAPFDLRRRLEELIEREIALSKSGKQGRMIVKVNAVDDPEYSGAKFTAGEHTIQVR